MASSSDGGLVHHEVTEIASVGAEIAAHNQANQASGARDMESLATSAGADPFSAIWTACIAHYQSTDKAVESAISSTTDALVSSFSSSSQILLGVDSGNATAIEGVEV